jgi:hypothetical protein
MTDKAYQNYNNKKKEKEKLSQNAYMLFTENHIEGKIKQTTQKQNRKFVQKKNWKNKKSSG